MIHVKASRQGEARERYCSGFMGVYRRRCLRETTNSWPKETISQLEKERRHQLRKKSTILCERVKPQRKISTEQALEWQQHDEAKVKD